MACSSTEHLLAEVTVDELVNFRQLLRARVRVGVDAGNEFELGLAVIGRNVRMGERGTQGPWVGRIRKRAIHAHAQTFLFDPAPQAAEDLRRQRGEALVEDGHPVVSEFLLILDGNP